MKQCVLAFICALAASLSVIIDDVYAQGLQPNPDVPRAVHRRVATIEGAAKLDVIKTPGDFTGSKFVARVVFKPVRPGYKACPDHYPPRHVRNEASCPDLRNDDPPASGWKSCYGAFYTPASFGCPPEPQVATAPATTPPPRCDFGPEICKKEVPGGPILIRTLQETPISRVRLPAPTEVLTRTHAQSELQRAAGSVVVAQPAERVVMAERVTIPPAARDALRLQPQLRRQLQLQTNLICRGGDCAWGGNNTPILLPAPPVTPFRHTRCEYEHVWFFVFENRYCPKERAGERPGAGTSVYVSWDADDQDSAVFYYHRDDFDGVIRVLRRILGSSDDRYRMSEATDREKAAARATAMLIKTAYVSEPDTAGFVTLEDNPASPRLCSDERFYGLPQPGRCSGVKVGDRLVATSGHCMRNQRQCRETSVVFNYFGSGATSMSRTVPAGSVYQCTSRIASRRPDPIDERGADWAIFEVDRDIDAPSAALESSGNVHPSLVTTVIGHPLGLPTVVTRFGVVQTTTTQYFIANSDTFIGNSGSAVFSAQSVEDRAPRVIGLLTGGAYDFEDSIENGQECLRAAWCNGPECLGDDVVYSDDLIAALARHDAEQ